MVGCLCLFVSPELVGNLVRGVRQTAYCFQIRFQVTIVIPLLPYAKFLMYVPCDTDGHYNIIIGCYFTLTLFVEADLIVSLIGNAVWIIK